MKQAVFWGMVMGIASLFAQETTITLVNGKTIKGRIVKIEAEKYNGTGREPTSEISVVQGNSEYFLSFEKIASLRLVSTDDMSCYEDSGFKPTREFCSRKVFYEVTLKTPDKKNKQKIEIIDERKFIFTLADTAEPVVSFFYKIMASDEGKEAEMSLKDLEKRVKDLQQNGIRTITF